MMKVVEVTTPEDAIAHVLPLYDEYWRRLNPEMTKLEHLRLRASTTLRCLKPSSSLFVVADDSAIMGMTLIELDQDDHGLVCLIQDFYVRESPGSTRAAIKLYSEVHAMARQAGCRMLEANVSEGNRNVVEILLGRGFEPVRTMMRKTMEVDDERRNIGGTRIETVERRGQSEFPAGDRRASDPRQPV